MRAPTNMIPGIALAAVAAAVLATSPVRADAPAAGATPSACSGHMDHPVTPAYYAECLAPRGPAPASMARPEAAAPPGTVHFIAFPPVRFESGKAGLSDTAKVTLDYVAGAVQGWPGMRRLIIIGYADSRGTAAYNQALSARRAAAVAQYLQTRGLSAAALAASAKGAHEPADQSWTAAGRARNRRVEVYALLR